MKKKFFLLSLFLILILLFVFFRKIPFKNFFEQPYKKRNSDMLLEFKNITLSGWHKGEKQWEIKAEYVKVSKDRRITTFHKIISGTFYKDNKKVANFKAEKAVYDSLTSSLEVSGNIEITARDNLKINTSCIIWDGNKKILYTDSPVFLTFGNSSVVASSLVARNGIEIVDLKDVFITLEVEEAKKKLKIEG